MSTTTFQTLLYDIPEPGIARIRLNRPDRANAQDTRLLYELNDAFDRAAHDDDIRVIILAAEGKHFCAGANLAGRKPGEGPPRHPKTGRTLYGEAALLLGTRKPIIAAVHGSAIGAGLGLAVVADFRVTCDEARFSANFNRLGYHPGFGLTTMLPRLLGEQQAALLFYTGRRVSGSEAVRIGLADELVAADQVLPAAVKLAAEMAECAPLSVMATRRILRRGKVEDFIAATKLEDAEQAIMRHTEDYAEGVKASTERRTPVFKGR